MPNDIDALHLPEVLLMIAPTLSRQDQASCARVNRHWHAIFSPLLWRSVSLTYPSRLSVSDLASVNKNICQIASFDWRSRSSVQRPEFPSFPTMQSLESLRFFEGAFRLESLTLEGDFELLPILQVLIKANTAATTSEGRQELGLSRLRRLTVRSTSAKQETVSVDHLLQALQRLQECAIESRVNVTECEDGETWQGSSSTLIRVSSLRCQPKNLRSLDISIRSLTREGLARVLRRCPSLEHLKVVDYGTVYVSEGFGDLLQQTCPLLKSLVLVAHGHHVEGQELVQALMRFPRLNHLGIESMRWGDQNLMALQEHCPAIESLDIGMSSGWKIRSQTLQQFLVVCKGLKHLKVRGLRLAVEDMVDETGTSLFEWECKGLETLSIGFSQTGGRSTFASHDTSGARGQQQQQQLTASQIIHRQLSKLTRLKTLELLVPIIPSRLRVSPFRGSAKIQQAEKDLELLQPLQQLEQFRVVGSGHGSQLNEAQIKWMVQAWPKLERIVVPTSDHLRRQQVEAWVKQCSDTQPGGQSKLPVVTCQCCEQ